MKPSRPYSRTGMNALKARVKLRGLSAIDKRTQAARDLFDWRSDLIAAQGGDDLPPALRKAIDIIAREAMYLDHVDAWLLEQKSLISGKRRCVLPVLRERMQIADSFMRHLQMIGLERKAKELPSLQDYLASKSAPRREPAP